MQLGAASPERSECRYYDQTAIVRKDIPRSHPAKRSQDQFLAFAFCGADTCSLLALKLLEEARRQELAALLDQLALFFYRRTRHPARGARPHPQLQHRPHTVSSGCSK
ncbi:hypothetical protein HPB52_024444 [Rhipicephalus sanguineus]|uniref:Uncharacterized protein n=1 Tax=Rhipicephalus sanguineus TaxID=34632 RepID=A0A9D4YR42_RHISA|nr:hypothetical protein HPB52_024444 [Rhipicephalus sanguineus]